jgi:hypothetical protein
MNFSPLRNRFKRSVALKSLTFAKIYDGVVPSSASASQTNTTLCVAATASTASCRKITLIIKANFTS